MALEHSFGTVCSLALSRPMCPLLLAGFLCLLCAVVQAAPASRQRPYLFPAPEKQRILDRLGRSDLARQQFADLCARADQGDAGSAALAYALSGERRYAETARTQLLGYVRYRTPSLEADVAAGGHREGNMDFYWSTEEVRWYDLIYPTLSGTELQEVEAFFRKLGHYWVDSLRLWTTTPNLILPIHYHAAVIGCCLDDAALVDWGLHDPGGQFGPTKGGLFPVLNSMLRDGAVWDEAALYAVVNVLTPMLNFAVISKLYEGQDLYDSPTETGASIRKLIDGYLALGYPRERLNETTDSFRVATYGDGSTAHPLRGAGEEDAYLVNRQYKRGPEMTGQLELAYYLSHDPQYAWFLAQASGHIPSLLYGEDLDRTTIKPPPAPSTIFPEAGIAMLRADESPNYWASDSPAVLQVMARGYGHDHRDKLSIVFHAAGRLLYPDLNCVQYEQTNVHWTRNGIAHNTLLVDKQDPSDAPYQIKHDFSPEVKFLATAAACYPGVNETRVLALTPDYLLDLFQAKSEVPHTYDWVVHAIGKVGFAYPELARPTRDLLQDYWWVQDERSLATNRTWSADFVQKTGLAVPGYGLHDKTWFNDQACVRVTMLGEPQTQVYTGYGPTGGPPADPVMNPEGELPLLLARREECATTTFAALHEPYKRDPVISDVRRLVATDEAYVVSLRSDRFEDRVAVAFNHDGLVALRSDHDAQETFAFTDFGYLRYAPAERRLVASGNWQGFQVRCPELPAQGALLVKGKPAPYTKQGDYVQYGRPEQAQPSAPVIVASSQAPPLWAVPGQEFACAWEVQNTGAGVVRQVSVRPVLSSGLRAVTEEINVDSLPAGEKRVALFTVRVLPGPAVRDERVGVQVSYKPAGAERIVTVAPLDLAVREPLELILPAGPFALPKQGTKQVTVRVKNWSASELTPALRLNLPARVQSAVGALPPLPAGGSAEVPVTFTTEGQTEGLFEVSAQVGRASPGAVQWGRRTPLKLCVGPVLLEDLTFPAFGEYVAYSPNYTFRLSQLYGASRSFRDDKGRPLYEKTFWNRRTSFEFSQLTDCLPMMNIEGKPVLLWGQPSGFFWPRRSPAGLSMSAEMSRYEWRFEEERITIRPVLYWSEDKPHEVVFPPGWAAWGGNPTWLRIWTVDETGQERTSAAPPPGEAGVRFTAAALQLPGQDKLVVFGVDRPQTARFSGAELRFTVRPGEMFWFGLCPTSADLDKWVKRQQSNNDAGD